ncbi:hypothetical protein CVU75_01165 [Candidatus Dependentiae bacterium HGW-Dependentiae-1]|nr:MAG: hypothetical protein CVU75_01165 [Candidatus Dependentiae bacterium HGW-Dependentiae-1]
MYKELVESAVKGLVEKPEAVVIVVRQEQEKELLEITVDAQDRGRVIGKEGQTIRAIRMMVSALIPRGKEIQIIIVE